MNVRDANRPLWPCFTYGLTLFGLFALIRSLSPAFIYEQAQTTRPVPLVLLLFGAAFAVHLVAIWYTLQVKSRYLPLTILGFAVSFRFILLLSVPIQEIDIYRYIWDGNATASGVSPFEYSPQEVLLADPGSAPESLLKLVAVRDDSAALKKILERIHYGQLPTVYPPISQAVFALAAMTTPEEASIETHLQVMKVWLAAFDVLTILFIGLTLRQANLHMAWLMTYAWCPLVMKEFANSGHLDAIAVCLSSAAIYFAFRAFYVRDEVLIDFRLPYASFGAALVGSLLLGLAIGAKLYPVVLAPLLAFTAWKRLGWPRTLVVAAVFFAVAACSLAPMLKGSDRITPEKVMIDRQAGLKAFFSQWMMNDFIFLNLAENMTPDSLRSEEVPRPWFVVAPNMLRENVAAVTARVYSIDISQAPFFAARTITALVFLALAMWFAVRAMQAEVGNDWLEYVFLTMAWFWLLLPTLNPWYWVWALPWIGFAKNRTWLMMSGLVFLYYLRFHLGGHFPDQRVLAWLPYYGEAFFDYIVVWFEYVPWFTCLISVYWFRRRQDVTARKASSSLPR